ncbi:MAG: DUF2288 domain-containing protein [Gammaproteobacteria bacterium]|nr:DUF2288 domain-containing protein [Gammaproteobacteria bacterium]MBL7000356.1 DUF2288 domain-containing protein [Gammaproteobacteria bacterium]
MSEQEITSQQLIRGKLNSETARIPWKELQRHFASGYTLFVSLELDLIDVAYQFEQDNAQQIELWLNAELIHQVRNDQAREWYNNDATLWACVVSPWVLLQHSD